MSTLKPGLVPHSLKNASPDDPDLNRMLNPVRTARTPEVNAVSEAVTALHVQRRIDELEAKLEAKADSRPVKKRESAAGKADNHEERPALPIHAYQRLPKVLNKAVSYFDKWYERDVYLTALIATLSSALPNVRFQYGKTYYSPHLFAFVLAHAASGKGVMAYAFRWLLKVDELLIQESQAEHKEWERRKQEYEDARKSRKKETPLSPEPPGEEPPERCLMAGEDMSAAAICKRLANNPEGVFVGSTEADAVSRANGKDWGGFSDVLRRAFHHESISVDRTSSEAVRVRDPRLALVLSGTPDQFGRLVQSIEDGLYSRFTVYHFQGERRYESQRPTKRDREFVAHLEEMQGRVLSLYQMLRDRREPLYVDFSGELWDMVDKPFAELYDHVSRSAPVTLDATIKRGALIAFRMASVFAVLRQWEAGADLSKARSIEAGREDVEAACSLALTYTEHGLRQAVEILRASDKLSDDAEPDVEARASYRLTGVQRALLDALPDAFTTSKAEEAIGADGPTLRTLFRWLDKWHDAGIIRRVKHGSYEKLHGEKEGGVSNVTFDTSDTLAPNEPHTPLSDVSLSPKCHSKCHSENGLDGLEKGKVPIVTKVTPVLPPSLSVDPQGDGAPHGDRFNVPGYIDKDGEEHAF